MRVAVWGSYTYGNYGDEAMAIQMATHLKRLGAEPVVFGLTSRLSTQYGIHTAPTAEDLIRGASFCVFGGGSLLSGNKTGPSWYLDQKRREFEELRVALERHSCPIHFISIGGDGKYGSGGGLAPFRLALLRSDMCRDATVRQEEDVALLKSDFGIDGRYFPDTFLCLDEAFEIPSRESAGPTRIGLCLPRSYGAVLAACRVAGTLLRDTEFHFIDTVRKTGGIGRFPPSLGPASSTRWLKRTPYRDPGAMLDVLSSLDLLVTNKLHVGIAALVTGTPYACVTDRARVHEALKCRAFLSSIGAGFAYLGELPDRRAFLGLMRLLFSGAARTSFAAQYEGTGLEELRSRSRGHLDRLSEIYHEYGARSKAAPC